MAARGNQLTSTRAERRRMEIAKLDRMGYNQFQIAEVVGVSQPVVCEHLAIIRESYRQQVIRTRDEQLAEVEAVYKDLMMEAFQAYQRSKKATRKVVEQYVKPRADPEQGEGAEEQGYSTEAPAEVDAAPTLVDALVLIGRTVTREGRLPANQYLQTIAHCLDAIRQLRGLDAPVKQQTQVTTFDWNDFLRQASAVPGQVGSGGWPQAPIAIEGSRPSPNQQQLKVGGPDSPLAREVDDEIERLLHGPRNGLVELPPEGNGEGQE